MRIANSVHQAHAWVISQITHDFKLMDVWALPAEGERDEFDSLLEIVASFDPADAGSAVSSALFWIRFRLGELFGWDKEEKRSIPGAGEASLSARLPEDLRGSASGPAISDAMRQAAGGFIPLYRTQEEWAAELSNATVHGVLHLAWVDQGEGRYRGELAIYVKPRGKLGEVYLRLIGPFRHLIVYPALMRQIDRRWNSRSR
ncbi:MAG TPA: DUF2867 domain-containing protein [Actinomycetota bacterium]|nr:DUF2867 domain-containing protein [Actinomycetota bacterium]